MPPIREYVCKDCEHIFENLERSQDDAATECSRCRSPKIERLVSSHGGYNMDSGPASVRPKNAGSFKK